jgi:hypothetical protein
MDSQRKAGGVGSIPTNYWPQGSAVGFNSRTVFWGQIMILARTPSALEPSRVARDVERAPRWHPATGIVSATGDTLFGWVKRIGMSAPALATLLIASAIASACARRVSPPTPVPTTGLALRVVDSSRRAEPLLAVWLRLIGPQPRPDTVACSDSTSQAVLWVPSIQPGRYRVVVNRIGFDGRSMLIDVAEHQIDTVTIGLRHPTRDVEDRVATSPRAAHCTAPRIER